MKKEHDRKKILMVVNSPMNNSGVQNVVMAIIRNLSEEYCFDVLVYTNKVGIYDKEIEALGGSVYHADLWEYSHHKILYLRRITQLKRVVERILGKQEYYAIHCHNGLDAGICLYVAQKNNVPVRINHAHGEYVHKSKSPVLQIYYDICMRYSESANLRIACSQSSGVSLFGESNFYDLLNPVDYKYYSSFTPKPHEGINLLQIGYYNTNKNQIFSLSILNEMKKRGINVHLYFIGYTIDRMYFEKMISFVNASKLTECVTFLDANVDKEKYMEITDFLLLPSYSEGLPLVVLEAQAAGIKCLLSNAITAAVNFGGCYYPGDSVEQWVEMIINNKQIMPEIDSKLENYDCPNFARTMRDLYVMEL